MKESKRLGKKISRLLKNFEFTRQICKNRIDEQTYRLFYLPCFFFHINKNTVEKTLFFFPLPINSKVPYRIV